MTIYVVVRSVRYEGDDLLLVTRDKARAERVAAHYSAIQDLHDVAYQVHEVELDKELLPW